MLMETDQVKMHGSVFFLLKKYVTGVYPAESWDRFVVSAGIGHSTFELTDSYPIADFESLVSAISAHAALSRNAFIEQFGEYIVPDLFLLYKDYLNPAWKTFDVLENTETVMHGAVRKLNSTANPPVLNVMKVNENLLIVDYHSRRRMGSLAVGIIRGIAKYFNEDSKISIVSVTEPDDYRVQIRVTSSTR